MRRRLKDPTVQGALAVWLVFLILTTTDRFNLSLYLENYFMSITMLFGSLIAGATCEGGGAVAFPVMTLIFGISPHRARDFSLMIQTIGMIAAAYTIFRLRIKVVHQAIIWGSLGGALGVCLGISWLGPSLNPPTLKLFFLSLWLSFGVALYLMNLPSRRSVKQQIQGFKTHHGALLFVLGIMGGCVSGMTGSGLDIIIFSLLTLGFRIDEKIATPTSVVLMGLNAGVGFLWRLVGSTNPFLAHLGATVLAPIEAETWNYWYVSMAIVVIGAPMGARLITGVKRMTVVYLLLASVILQFLGGLLIVPWKEQGLGWLIITSFLGGSAMFGTMSWLGKRRLRLSSPTIRIR